jgi:hypothetical protein
MSIEYDGGKMRVAKGEMRGGPHPRPLLFDDSCRRSRRCSLDARSSDRSAEGEGRSEMVEKIILKVGFGGGN